MLFPRSRVCVCSSSADAPPEYYDRLIWHGFRRFTVSFLQSNLYRWTILWVTFSLVCPKMCSTPSPIDPTPSKVSSLFFIAALSECRFCTLTSVSAGFFSLSSLTHGPLDLRCRFFLISSSLLEVFSLVCLNRLVGTRFLSTPLT